MEKITKTITGRIIRITPNMSKKTFTIRTDSATYRTFPLEKEEFQSARFWEGDDWAQFLKTDDYYFVKNKKTS